MNQRIPKAHFHRGQARLRLRIGPKQYQELYCGPWGTPAAVAQEAQYVAAWLASGGLAPTGRPAVTVAEVVAAYLGYCRGYYRSAGGESKQFARVRRAFGFVVELYGTTAVRDFGPVALAGVRARMVATGWTRRFVNANVQCLKRGFRWAVAQELIDPSIYQRLAALDGLRKGRTTAPEGAGRTQPVPAADVDAVLPRVGPAVAAMIRLQQLTGMRPGEVVIMRGADIDRCGPWDTWVYCPPRFKGDHYDGRVDEVFLGPQARAVLAPFLAADPAAYLFSPRTARHVGRRTGERYSVYTYCQAVEYGCKAAGVARWTPKRLRHTRATELRPRYGLDGVQSILRHRHASTTEIYAGVTRELAARIMAETG